MTYGEKVRAMSDEELSRFLAKMYYLGYAGACSQHLNVSPGPVIETFNKSAEMIKEKLQQEVEDHEDRDPGISGHGEVQ